VCPKKNPKHEKKFFYVRKKQYESGGIPIKYFVMGFIFVISITGVVLLAIFLPDGIDNGDKLYIEDGDTVELSYKLWTVYDIGDLDTSNPTADDSESWITKVSKDGLINGFYYELLDREFGEIFEFVIDKETDVDPADGFDDNTGDEILGYADGKILFFWVQVLNITKSAENIPAAGSLDNIELPVQMENFSENNFQCNVREFFIFEFLNNY